MYNRIKKDKILADISKTTKYETQTLSPAKKKLKKQSNKQLNH
jgi:hypothetical protein